MSTSTFLNSSSNRSSLLNEPDLISESTDALNLNNAEVDSDSIFHSSLSGSAVTSPSHSVRSLSGIGDASHSGAVTTETGDGVPNATVLNEAEQNEEDFTKTQPVKISFRYLLTPRTILNWHTLLINDNLYIEIPKGCLPDASKEAFVALLEYAEDVLHCRHAVVCFKKDRVDRDTLIRTFMFLGFYLVPPGSELAHPEATDIVLLVYKID